MLITRVCDSTPTSIAVGLVKFFTKNKFKMEFRSCFLLSIKIACTCTKFSVSVYERKN